MSLFSDQTSAQVAEEAEHERAGLVNTLDQLRENLRPGNVVDEVMSHATFDSTAVMDRVWQTARENPIPAALIGLGAAMLLGFGRMSSMTAAARPKMPNVGADRPLTTPRSFERTRYQAEPPVSRASQPDGADAVSSQTDRLAVNRSGSPLQNTADRVSAEVNSHRSAILGSGRTTASAIPSQPVRKSMTNSLHLKRSSSTLSRLFDEQPLVLAAIGVAVGAAVGAALPSTDVEAQLMGDASESVRQNAAAAARQQLSQLKATADQTYDQVKASVAEHGVSTSNLSDLVHDIGGQVKSATYTAAQQAADRLPRPS